MRAAAVLSKKPKPSQPTEAIGCILPSGSMRYHVDGNSIAALAGPGGQAERRHAGAQRDVDTYRNAGHGHQGNSRAHGNTQALSGVSRWWRETTKAV
ncbi:MAG TPA: hypothetical protein VKE93_16910 [Candidatus Angelobacter sp.]|nr:hypothetical protein [Candidatus Angelobacter sp.]